MNHRTPQSGNIITTAQSNDACAKTLGASLPQARAIAPQSNPPASAATGSNGFKPPPGPATARSDHAVGTYASA
jgi:hypothetical protein